MKLPEHYDSDVLFFFDGRPLELSLYEALFRHMEADFPAASVKGRKARSVFMESISSARCHCRCAERNRGRSTVSS